MIVEEVNERDNFLRNTLRKSSTSFVERKELQNIERAIGSVLD